MTDPHAPPSDDHQQALFSHLVMLLTTSTLQYLGRMPDPSGQPGEVHLDGAQAMIDTLDMLSAKTKGNLSAEETKMLQETLTSLKLAFVEQQRSAGAPTSGASEPAPAPTESAPSDAAPVQTPEMEPPGKSGREHKEPKFHKKYE